MSVRDGSECNKGSAAMSDREGACMGSEGVSERDCWEGLVTGILPSNKSRRYTTLVFFNPVTPSRITTSGISKSPEVRFLIV